MEIDKIYNMDCLEGMKQIPDGSVDAIICDLPYGTTACEWDTLIPFDQLWEQYNRIAKPDAPILLFGTEPFSSQIRLSNIKDYRYDWYWKKSFGSNFLNLKKQPYFLVETISVFYRKLPTYNPIMEKGEIWKASKRNSGQGTQQEYGIKQRVFSECLDGMHYPDNLVDIPYGNGNRIHPTQKPVDLLRYLIRTYSNEGDTILDNCMGSGTTAVACIKEKRHFIGFELNKEYYDKACQRIDAEQR